MDNHPEETHRKAVIGNPDGLFWLWDSKTGFDLTHPATPTTPQVKDAVTIKTTAMPITVDPAKSALVVVDMQNFFLSPALGRPLDSKGLLAQQELIRYAIPAARKAGIRVVWLNWGLTQEEIDAMPPATLRAFGFETIEASQFESFRDVQAKQAAIDSHGVNEGADKIATTTDPASGTPEKPARLYKGLGSDLGPVTLDNGKVVNAGKLLMRDQWNSDLTPELSDLFRQGLTCSPPDVWIHKNRMSGLWGEKTMCTEFLDQEGIKTLFFAGVNTDQCVGGSLTDAFAKGYDCVLLSDGCGTTSPAAAQQCIEFNAAKTWGFCTTCKELWEGASTS